MDWWIILLTIIVGALFIYFLSIRNLDYFKKRGVPFVKPIPMFGNGLEILLKKKTMFEVMQKSYDCSPDARYVGYYEFLTPIIMLKDPELIKSIGVKNFDSFPNHKMMTDFPSEPLLDKNLFSLKDDEWRDMRALLSPAFTSSKMKMMFKTLSDCAVNFANHLSKLDGKPTEINIKETFGRYTLDIIASVAFGLNIDSMKDQDNEFYRLGKAFQDFSSWKMIQIFLFRMCPWLAKIIDLRFIDRDVANYFTNAIETTIATRDAEGIVRPDMIQLMMQARDKKEKSALTLEDMTAQAFIFFLGGFDSPAAVMSFATYSLALFPDVQRKLQAEIDEVLENSSNGEVSYEDLHNMKYLDAVISETLRMFPPGPFLDRVVAKSFTLPPALPGSEPLQLEPGQVLWIAVHQLHRDPKYFSDPEKFDPERFNDDNKSKINPLTYLPFGLGPRICIANRFALMEVKLALFHTFAKCNFSPTARAELPIKFSTDTFALKPKGGFEVKVEPRN